MDIGDGLKALADALPWVALCLGTGYAIGYAFKEHWREGYKVARERARVGISLLNKGSYDLKNSKDIYVFSKTVDALIGKTELERDNALADIADALEPKK
jgi:hypothetical protein